MYTSTKDEFVDPSLKLPNYVEKYNPSGLYSNLSQLRKSKKEKEKVKYEEYSRISHLTILRSTR